MAEEPNPLVISKAMNKHASPLDAPVAIQDSKNVPTGAFNSGSNPNLIASPVPTALNDESYKFHKTPRLESLAFTFLCLGIFGLMVVRRCKRAFI